MREPDHRLSIDFGWGPIVFEGVAALIIMTLLFAAVFGLGYLFGAAR